MKMFSETGVYPFWFWNGEIEEKEIRQQLDLIKGSGCRGVIIHSRKGNRIPYLSERWFELVRHACVHALKSGLKIWIYDEDGYPSGNAGGKVLEGHPVLSQKSLVCRYGKTDPEQPSLAAYDASSFHRLDESKVPANTPALLFCLKELPSHIDTLNPEAAGRFISITHEQYYQKLPEFFGTVIEAFYTDDVSFLSCLTEGYVFSPVLENAWQQRFGQSIFDILPLLAEEFPGSKEVRLRYFRLAQELFLENFVLPQRQWCNAHGVCYIGHLCYDEGPQGNSISSFGSAMPFMKCQDIPSIDDFLLEMNDQRYLARPYNDDTSRALHVGNRRLASLKTYKQGASIAHQFGDGRLSAETLTYLLWEVSPDFLNLQMLFELGMGVNLITPHAFYYTVGGVAGYDSVPSYFYQQPWFAHCSGMIAVWNRIAELLKHGSYHCDTLVLEPSDDIGAMCGSEALPAFAMRTRPPQASVFEIHDVLVQTVLLLHRSHVGFDLGDDVLLAENATVSNGVLTLGRMHYKTVVLTDSGDCRSMRTREILKEFQASGGLVLEAGKDDLSPLRPDVQLSGEGCQEILVHARDNNDFTEVFMLNLSGRDLRPELNFKGAFSVYDPMTGKSFPAEGRLPTDFVLRAGDLCMLMPPLYSEGGSWAESRYVSKAEGKPPQLKCIRPLNDNILPLHPRENFELLVPDYAEIKWLYAENLADARICINGNPVTALPGCHHPADPAFEAGDVSKLFTCGLNRISFKDSPEIVRLGGNFQVVRAERPWGIGKMELQLGDLSVQGYPFYWGAFEYVFTFDGVYSHAELKLEGMAEIFVNGQSCGHVFGKPYVLFIGTACRNEGNELRIVLCNTAQNFIRGESPVPFGLYGVKLLN